MQQQPLTEVQIKLINILEAHFQPAENAVTHPLNTTADMFAKLQSIFPSKDYEPEDVLAAMTYLQYETMDSTTGNLYWLVQPKP